MDFKKLKNLEEGDYIWLLPPGTMCIGYVARVISIMNTLITTIKIYSKRDGYDEAKSLLDIGYKIVPLKELTAVNPKDLTPKCYIVLEDTSGDGMDRYEAEAFYEVKENDVLCLNGHDFHYDPLKHRIYKMPVPYR